MAAKKKRKRGAGGGKGPPDGGGGEPSRVDRLREEVRRIGEEIRLLAQASAEGSDEDPSGELPLADRLARVTAPRELADPEMRKRWGLPADEGRPGPYLVELNLQHAGGLTGAANAFEHLFEKVVGSEAPGAEEALKTRISKSYYRCLCSYEDVRKLIAEDAGSAEAPEGLERQRSIYRIWPDFPVQPLVDRSISTIKADAALRAFAANGSGITWAVVDSGVQGDHAHFAAERTLASEEVADLHRCFTDVHEERDGLLVKRPRPLDPDADPSIAPDERAKRVAAHRAAALRDEFGHGTHVAGILAGAAPAEGPVAAFEHEYKADGGGNGHKRSYRPRRLADPPRLRGVAQGCRLVSLKVLDAKGEGRASNVIQALEYVREKVNDDPKLLRIHGINLSVGYEFDAEMFACGQSPLCVEVDRLVQAGVVVVAAAGNTGYGALAADVRATKVGLSNTINDPGNATLAITVGSTHRDAPHTYGVSYFSSKGPTGDGRLKPDLIAPGERITSCAAGRKLTELTALAQQLGGGADFPRTATYVDQSGTSMAAPHVSGAIAAFLSIRREFIGKPLEVKRIFVESATSLGRERYFEGHGLVDLMRAIQSV